MIRGEGQIPCTDFLCIYIFMLVFCEKWNIMEFEATNQFAPRYGESMIRGVIVKGEKSFQETAERRDISVRRVYVFFYGMVSCS